MATIDLLVVGGIGVDTVVRLDELPPPLMDSVHVPPIQDYVGHTGNGVALAAKALGLRTKLVDFIGEDMLGAFLRDAYAKAALDTHLVTSPGGTRRSVNLVGPDGQRISLYDGRAVPGQTLPAEAWEPYLAQARHILLSIMPYAAALAAEAQRRGVPISTDLHDWDGINPYHWQFAEQADIVFLSAANLEGSVGDVLKRIMNHGRASIAVATAGRAGSFLQTRDKSDPQRIPAQPVSVVDASGAGDAYAAAFLYGVLDGLPPFRCAELGAIAGAHACTTPGTHQGFLSSKDLVQRWQAIHA